MKITTEHLLVHIIDNYLSTEDKIHIRDFTRFGRPYSDFVNDAERRGVHHEVYYINLWDDGERVKLKNFIRELDGQDT